MSLLLQSSSSIYGLGASYVQVALFEGVGSILLIGLVSLLATSFILWKIQAGLGLGAFIVTLQLGILYTYFNNAGEQIGSGFAGQAGTFGMLFFLVLALSGLMFWHLLSRRGLGS